MEMNYITLSTLSSSRKHYLITVKSNCVSGITSHSNNISTYYNRYGRALNSFLFYKQFVM